METPPPSSHSAHSSLLQHVLLLEQARQQTAMLGGANTIAHTAHTQKFTTAPNSSPFSVTLDLSSAHVQPIAAGYGRERCVGWHAGRQQAASPPAAGSYAERTFAPVPPGPAATGGSTAAPSLPGEALQGRHNYTHTHTQMSTRADSHIIFVCLCVCRCCQRGQIYLGHHPLTQRKQRRSLQRPMTCRRRMKGWAFTGVPVFLCLCVSV